MGRLVTFDGIDASGKTTQAKILEKNLCAEGKKTLYLSFPVYESEGSAPVRLYLGGGLGKEPEQTNAYAASSFFAVDRYISYVTDWRAFLEEPGSIVITNRYTTANAI
ncbi:MAG: thymidylate kinase, partial [Oscillospiraceae bacterium]|nr:thymidylate kinase [Oscillospiraceae bacterium]